MLGDLELQDPLVVVGDPLDVDHLRVDVVLVRLVEVGDAATYAYSNFSLTVGSLLANFERPVFGCIEAEFSK